MKTKIPEEWEKDFDKRFSYIETKGPLKGVRIYDCRDIFAVITFIKDEKHKSYLEGNKKRNGHSRITKMKITMKDL